MLDLGSNNPSLPVTLLRAGAREVVAVELMPAAGEVSRPNARILSRRDIHPYDVQVLSGDIRLFLSEDLGSFDVVTALCSLCFLPEAGMARIIQKAAAMNAVLILQANDAIDNVPAKTLDLHRLMRDNGYPEVQVHTGAGGTHAGIWPIHDIRSLCLYFQWFMGRDGLACLLLPAQSGRLT